ncbi:unnamed protein product [Meloidogyne enterolobii]|uniref:Uncharacterized protein n=1 Tax=Meloidogyne enterolobii TaxID=390850 RepID=A0ACB0ZNT1_MELEN
MVNITTKETEEEIEKSSFEATEKVVVSSGEMSFEAVPCMFKSRQEDGAEGSLFGLLIRPATIASTSTTTTELNNTILINNGVVNNDSGKDMLVATSGNVAIEGNPSSSTISTNQPSIMQVLPACTNNANSIRVNQQQMTSSVIIASKMLQFQQPKGRLIPSASFPLLPAPSGVPPILPKTSKHHHHQQKKLKNLLLKSSPKVIPIQPKIAKTSLSTLTKTTTFNKSDGCCSSNNINSLRPEMFAASLHAHQIPSTSQFQQQTATTNNLSISTSPNICQTSLDAPQQQQLVPSGLLSINLSPSQKSATITSKKCQKQQKTPIKENKKGEEKSSSSSSPIPQTPPNKLKKHQKRNNKKIKQLNQQSNSEVMLGEDLHEIDLSQLVNSTVITTEDYLPRY